MQVRALVGVRQESVGSGTSLLSGNQLETVITFQNERIQSRKSVGLSSAHTLTSHAINAELRSAYGKGEFRKGSGILKFSNHWQSRNRSTSALKQHSFKQQPVSPQAAFALTVGTLQPRGVVNMERPISRIRIQLPPDQTVPDPRRQIALEVPKLQFSSSFGQITNAVLHYSSRSGPTGLQSENSLQHIQRRELRRIKEQVFKRRPPPGTANPSSTFPKKRGNMKSVDMQTEEGGSKSVVSDATANFETPRQGRRDNRASIENSDTPYNDSGIPTLTKLEPRIQHRIDEKTEETERGEATAGRRELAQQESEPPISEENRTAAIQQAPRARLAQHDNSLHYSIPTNSVQSEQAFEDMMIGSALPERPVRPRIRGVKLSEIKSISSKSSRLTPKQTEGIRSGDLSLHNIGVSFTPKLGSLANVRSSFANQRRQSLMQMAAMQTDLASQQAESQPMKPVVKSMELVHNIVAKYKQSRQGEELLDGIAISGENIQQKLSSNRHFQYWVEKGRQQKERYMVSRNTGATTRAQLSSSTPLSRRPICSVPGGRVNVETSIMETASFRDNIRYRPAPILSHEGEEETSLNDKATTRVITPASYAHNLRNTGNFAPGLVNIGSPKESIRRGAGHSEGVSFERNPMLLTSLNSATFQFPFSTKSATCKRATFPDTATYSCITAKTCQLQHRLHPTYILSKDVDKESAAEKIMRHTAYNFLTHANATDSLLSDEYSKLTTPSKTSEFQVEQFFKNPPSPKLPSTAPHSLVQSLPPPPQPRGIFQEKGLPVPDSPFWSLASRERFITEQGAKPEGQLLRRKQAFRERLLEKFTKGSKADPRLAVVGARGVRMIRARRSEEPAAAAAPPTGWKRLRKGKVFSDSHFDPELCNGKFRKI